MKKNSYYVIGVMSGTSLDGIDLCYVHFKKDDKWNFQIISSETIPYSKEWVVKLNEAIQLNDHELFKLDTQYTNHLYKVISKFINVQNKSIIDAVCSHGHTVFHEPQKGITKQIGNLPFLAKKLGHTVICDFRTQDVQLGGQGAPLVPIGDKLLFNSYKYCLNLGGFSNISYDANGIRIAYDICPVNIVLNYYARFIDLQYDDQGNHAKSGSIHQMLLTDLNNLSYYNQKTPKSLGLEWVKTEIFPLIDSYHLSVKDILRTFVEHVAMQITTEFNTNKNDAVLITGGGIYNNFLMKRIKELSLNNVVVPSAEIVNYKEALIFGLLGVLKLRNEINCLSSVTGASKDHCSGQAYLP